MRSILSALILSAVPFFVFSSSNSGSTQTVQWDSSSYREFYLDANGDGVQDVLLQAVDSTYSPKLIAGKR